MMLSVTMISNTSHDDDVKDNVDRITDDVRRIKEDNQ
jgi:hypothetical protein